MACVVCLIVTLVSCIWTHQATGQTPRSIRSVPADAAFYFGLHNQADLVRRVAGSETVKKIRALAGADFNFQESVGIDINYDADENAVVDPADYLAVLKQLLRSDAFLYGDANWTQTLKAVPQLTRQTSQARKEQGDNYDAAKFFLSLPDNELAKIRMPATVLGFQLDDVDPAQRGLDQLHAWLNANPPPPWARYRGRKPVADDQMLVFTLRPWESGWITVTDNDADTQAVLQKLQRIIEERELVIAFGVVRSRLLFCLAEDLSAVRSLVSTELDDQLEAIADQTDFASLLSEQDGALIASAYVADDFVAARNELQAPGAFTCLSAIIGAVPSMITNRDEIDATTIGLIIGFTEQLSEKLAAIATRWDALAIKPSGWSAAMWAGPGGVSGRSVVRAVDDRLPASPLDAHQFSGDHVLFVYGWQSTTLAERLLLGLETAETLIDVMTGGVLLAFEQDDSPDPELEKLRLGRTKLTKRVEQLNMIIREQWLPSLHDGGHAIVLSTIDPIPETADESPVAITLLTRVSNAQNLQRAGTSLRNWANDFVADYYATVGEPLAGPVIPVPVTRDDLDSQVFQFPLGIFGSSDDDESAEPATFHWRLNDQVLAFGFDEAVTKKIVQQHNEDRPDRPGVLRSVAELSFAEISDLYAKATKMVSDDEKQAMLQASDIIGTLGVFRSETRTIDGQTRTYWQLTMPLGE